MEDVLVEDLQQVLIPNLRFLEYSNYWTPIIFGDHVTSSAFGPRFSSDLYRANGNIATLRTTDIDEDGGINYTNAPLAELDVERFNDHLLKEGDLVISRSGTIGITAVFAEHKVPVIPGAFLIRFRLVAEKLDPSFIKYYLNSTKGRNKLETLSAGGVQKNLKGSSVLKLKLIIPSLPEQQKIASFLSAVDEKIQLLKRKKELLEQYKKGVVQLLISGKLRFKDEHGEDYPDWEQKKLGEVLDYIQPTQYIVAKAEYNQTYSIPVLTAGKTFILGYTDETVNVFTEPLPVILFDDFTTAIQFVDFSFKVKSSALKILVANEGQNLSFIYEAMQQINFEVGGHGRHWISQYSSLTIPYPSLAEQKKIADFLMGITNKIKIVQEQITLTQTFKKGLLQQMFV